MVRPHPQVNSRGWRKLPPADLEDLILGIRRSAERRHLDAREWRELDRMRSRCAALRKEGALPL
jgi:hypothetical protein